MVHHLKMHMLCTYKPDTAIECEHLRKLFACVGVKLPSRETFLARDVWRPAQGGAVVHAERAAQALHCRAGH